MTYKPSGQTISNTASSRNWTDDKSRWSFRGKRAGTVGLTHMRPAMTAGAVIGLLATLFLAVSIFATV